MWIKSCSLNDDTVLGIIGYKAMRTLIKPGLGLLNFTENSVMLNGLLGCKHHSCMRPERSRNQEWTSRWYSHLSHTSACLSLSASADYHRHSCLGCIGSCGGLCYLHSLSLFIWPVLSLVLASSPIVLADGCSGAGALWGQVGIGLEHHVAQEMAALCSLAFIRSAAMLEDFRSGSTLRS